MILIDYSQVMRASLSHYERELMREDEEDVKNILRHITLTQILKFNNKFKKDFGNIVICCDADSYWRRDVFPHYKANRKKAKEASLLNWQLINKCLKEVKEEIKKYLPYKIIEVDKAEADDVIATLANFADEKCVIISADQDFKQLSSEKVTQYSSTQNKFYNLDEEERHRYKVEHIVRGDTGDGIPNIKSDDDTFVTTKRQPPIYAKLVEEFIRKGRDACSNDFERRNYDRNEQLVILDFTPENIKQNIISQFEDYRVAPRRRLLDYLVKLDNNLFINQLNNF